MKLGKAKRVIQILLWPFALIALIFFPIFILISIFHLGKGPGPPRDPGFAIGGLLWKYLPTMKNANNAKQKEMEDVFQK
ncbi:hypothetical protein [Spiroplasma culicicola]|nr:hypothetical protein [Spiroplasma culicicola]